MKLTLKMGLRPAKNTFNFQVPSKSTAPFPARGGGGFPGPTPNTGISLSLPQRHKPPTGVSEAQPLRKSPHQKEGGSCEGQVQS